MVPRGMRPSLEAAERLSPRAHLRVCLLCASLARPEGQVESLRMK